MIPSDNKLITEAYKIPYTEWMLIDDLIAEASSTKCKKMLERIKLQKFREEEYRNGDL